MYGLGDNASSTKFNTLLDAMKNIFRQI